MSIESILLLGGMLVLLIFVHELGHFIVAKWSGAKVEEFGFGFPPRIFGIRYGETLYSINLLPLGGFVKIFGEDGESASDSRSFTSKSIPVRASIITAGVVMNVFLAIILYTVGHGIGLPTVIESDETALRAENVRVQIMQVVQESPAESVGLRLGDYIVSLGAKGETIEIASIEDVQRIVEIQKGKEITISVARGEEQFSFSVIPRENPPEGEGALGISMLRVGTISYPWHEALWRGTQTSFETLKAITVSLGTILFDLVRTGKLAPDISGPVGIAVFASQVSSLGFIYLLQLVALLSLNLALINIVPFPALDGGRLLFLAIEFVKGSPVNRKVERIAHTSGFVLLILLMIAITVRDIGRFL